VAHFLAEVPSLFSLSVDVALVVVIVVVIRFRCQWSRCVVVLSSALTMMGFFCCVFLLGLDDENEDVDLVIFEGVG